MDISLLHFKINGLKNLCASEFSECWKLGFWLCWTGLKTFFFSCLQGDTNF